MKHAEGLAAAARAAAAEEAAKEQAAATEADAKALVGAGKGLTAVGKAGASKDKDSRSAPYAK